MEIQKYNVIVYFMLVLKKNTCVSHPLKTWVQFSIARFSFKPCQERTKVRVKIVLSGDFHCNIRGPAKGLELFPCFPLFSHAYGSSNYMYQIYMLS